MNQYKQWTTEELIQLPILINQGKTYGEISAILNRPISSTAVKARKLGFLKQNHRIWTFEEVTQLPILINQGKIYKEISAIFGRPNSSVYAKVLQLGLISLCPGKIQKSKELKKRGLKKCSRCKQILNIEEFSRSDLNGYCTYCRKCDVQKAKERCSKSIYNRLLYKLKSSERTAKRKNMPFNISTEYLLLLWKKQNGKCYYTDREMSIKTDQPNVVSIDRIDSKIGYIEGNICLCCAKINIMKSDLSIEEFKDWCMAVSSKE